MPSISTVLVANRGEIARRIIRSVHALGLRVAAVYSDADAAAPHVREADVAIRLGPAPAAQSYLDIEAVLRAVAESGADAVHPGYGFLSENAAFGAALKERGVVFVGPGPEALGVMGDKIRAKIHVAAAGVPITPGVAEPGLTDGELIRRAGEVGFPLLIKPSAGGGGQGMVEVFAQRDLPAALASARRTARGAFGDDTLFLERLVVNPRHVEVQILADAHGTVLHLGERECSLQRRHQKVMEEAPAPLLTAQADGGASLRARLGAAAVSAARSVGYVGAGTVEFLVSNDQPDEFFFMEMNTRLQVEHPVTEEAVRVRGRRLDLVAWQLRIAAGEALDFAQADVSFDGHAVEARVYAERPEDGFLPAVGPVHAVHFPSVQGVRVDAALDGPGEVSAFYDPMIAKVIAWAPEREEALRRLDAALAGTFLAGAGSNVDYLRALLADPDVRAGRLDTGLIARRPELTNPPPPSEAALGLLRATAADLERAVAPGWGEGSAWLPDGFRASGVPAAVRVRLELPGGEAWEGEVPAEPATGVGQAPAAEPQVLVNPNGGAPQLWVHVDGRTTRATAVLRAERTRLALIRRGAPEGAAVPEALAPMTGTVASVAVEDGASVKAGDTLLIIEAMKMEHPVSAPLAGTVRLHTRAGAQVEQGRVVAVIEEEA